MPLGGSIDYIYSCSYYQINGGWDYETNSYSTDDWSNVLTLSPTVTINGETCTIYFSAAEEDLIGSASTSCTQPISGYINPKYVVAGVTYAPSGDHSYVDYTNSTLVGNTTCLSSSFPFGVTVGVSVTSSAGILGFAGGKVTASSTTAYTGIKQFVNDHSKQDHNDIGPDARSTEPVYWD